MARTNHNPASRHPTRRGRWLLGTLCGTCVAVAGGLVSLRSFSYHLPPIADQQVVRQGDAQQLEAGEVVRMLVWNLQYCGSRRHHFFYDGGEAVRVSADDVSETLEAVAEVLADEAPELVLLQEVDRGSDRTGRLDQVAELLQRTPFPHHVTAPYHRVRYIPYPPHEHLGKMDMHLATLSRLELKSARRQQLPLLREPWYRRVFNLKRAILEVSVPLGDGQPPLAVLNTHLSAFSRGDGTLPAQVEVITGRLQELESQQRPWVLVGDLNMLPPGDDPSRLGDDSELYADHDPPILPLFEMGDTALRVVHRPSYPGDIGTYLPSGSDTADRTLDYVFVSEGVEVVSARVLRNRNEISDHLPLLVELRVRQATGLSSSGGSG